MTRPEERGGTAGAAPEAIEASSVDPAASMSLLTSLLANPLDAGYEHYRAEHGPRPASLIGRVGVFAVAVALGFGGDRVAARSRGRREGGFEATGLDS